MINIKEIYELRHFKREICIHTKMAQMLQQPIFDKFTGIYISTLGESLGIVANTKVQNNFNFVSAESHLSDWGGDIRFVISRGFNPLTVMLDNDWNDVTNNVILAITISGQKQWKHEILEGKKK